MDNNNINNIFRWEGEVRDNEIDVQGIVNHVNYFVYMGHGRHKHLKMLGIDITTMHQRGFDLVLIRSEMDFKASLKSWDEFIVTSQVERLCSSKIRLVFTQEIIRKSDQKVMAQAKNICTCIARASGRPYLPPELLTLLKLA